MEPFIYHLRKGFSLLRIKYPANTSEVPSRYVPPQRVGFLHRFSLKTGIDFAPFGLQTDMVFNETRGVCERIYCFNSKLVRQKEKYVNSKWTLRILFCRCSNLGNDDVIS